MRKLFRLSYQKPYYESRKPNLLRLNIITSSVSTPGPLMTSPHWSNVSKRLGRAQNNQLLDLRGKNDLART